MSSTARELDQFYTTRKVAGECLDFLRKTVPLLEDDWFLEPSAGDGAFFESMPTGSRCGVDLEPRCPGVRQMNFLTEFVPPAIRGRWITSGNPPFGKNASLAVRFFNRAAEFSEVVAFIVPLTFRKHSLQKRLAKNFVLVGELCLPEDAFLFEGRPYSVPCCFQVWTRTDGLRDMTDAPLEHKHFEFVSTGSADFAIRRVGGLAGKVLVNFAGYSPTSHYFIRAKIDTDLLVARFQSIDWNSVKWNTAGNPSISKRELIAKYSQVSRKRPRREVDAAKKSF